MAIPVIFSASFDTGDNSEWDSETDVSGALDFPHYTTLAGIAGAPAPYRGAYCMRIAAPGNTADHTLTEGDINIAAAGTAWFRFALYVSSDFAATADDIFNIFELQASSTVETAISLQVIAATGIVSIGIGETEASTLPSTVEKGKWHVVELSATVDNGAGNNGTSTLYLDGNAIQTISSLDQGAITDGVLGTQGTLSTTSTGYLLFDDFVMDDARYGITHRFSNHRIITNSSFLFVGTGRIGNVKLIDTGGGDCTLRLYDTDVYNASLEPIYSAQTITANVDVDSADVPIDFRRGCLAVLTGTLPAAEFRIDRARGWGSDGAVRAHAARRHPHPGSL